MKQEDIDLYTEKVELEMQKHLTTRQSNKNPSPIELDRELSSVIQTLKQIDATLPKKQWNSSHKPFWSQELKTLNKQKKSAWHEWVRQGRPRDSSNQVWLDYKAAKSKFRTEYRRAERNNELNHIKEIEDAGTTDKRYFWQLVNKYRRKTAKTMHPVKNSQGEMLTDSKALCATWRDYFSKLYTPVEDHANFDNDHRDHVTRRLEQMVLESYTSPTVILAEPSV